MFVLPPQPLPQSVQLACYACESRSASHVCRFKVGELAIQVCLCTECMNIDTRRILTDTVGIANVSGQPQTNFSIGNQMTR
jgi:hypothetical protein